MAEPAFPTRTALPGSAQTSASEADDTDAGRAAAGVGDARRLDERPPAETRTDDGATGRVETKPLRNDAPRAASRLTLVEPTRRAPADAPAAPFDRLPSGATASATGSTFSGRRRGGASSAPSLAHSAARATARRPRFDALAYLHALTANLEPAFVIERLYEGLAAALGLDGFRYVPAPERTLPTVPGGAIGRAGEPASDERRVPAEPAFSGGRLRGHSLVYRLTRNGVPLGEVTIWRGRRFTTRDESLAESIIGLTVASLHNAFEHARLARLVDVDPLTGLANRRGFERVTATWLADAERRMRPVSLLMLDIDRFKSINDRFGHAFGDRWIAAVGEVLRDALRDADPIARYGGEEFVVLLPGADLTVALRCAERVRQRIAELCLEADDATPVSTTVSVGVAEWRPGVTLQRLLETADRALYAAKRAGRDRVLAASTPD